jgi:hypothetical protein
VLKREGPRTPGSSGRESPLKLADAAAIGLARLIFSDRIRSWRADQDSLKRRSCEWPKGTEQKHDQPDFTEIASDSGPAARPTPILQLA